MTYDNISRLIKLNSLYELFETLTPIEKLFFEFHNNLHENSSGEFFNDDGRWVIHYDFNNNIFWFHYERFYLAFKQKFDIELQKFEYMCYCILYNYLNCDVLKVTALHIPITIQD